MEVEGTVEADEIEVTYPDGSTETFLCNGWVERKETVRIFDITWSLKFESDKDRNVSVRTERYWQNATHLSVHNFEKIEYVKQKDITVRAKIAEWGEERHWLFFKRPTVEWVEDLEIVREE